MKIRNICIFIVSSLTFNFIIVNQSQAGLKDKYEKRSGCTWDNAQYDGENEGHQDAISVRYCVTSDKAIIKLKNGYSCLFGGCVNYEGGIPSLEKGKVGKSETYSTKTPNMVSRYGGTYTSYYITEWDQEGHNLIRYRCEADAFSDNCSSPLNKQIMGKMRFNVGKNNGIYKEIITEDSGFTCKYIGQIRQGNPFGYGKQLCSKGSVFSEYRGEWNEGKADGQGTYVESDGSKYVGEWKNDLFDGKGTLTLSDGGKYVGEFKNDSFEGKGTATEANGNKYVGEWRNNLREGKGTYTWSAGEWKGDKYVGEFKNDLRNGIGRYFYANGDRYEGGFKDGLFHGKARFLASTESRKCWYIEQWENDIRTFSRLDPDQNYPSYCPSDNPTELE